MSDNQLKEHPAAKIQNLASDTPVTSSSLHRKINRSTTAHIHIHIHSYISRANARRGANDAPTGRFDASRRDNDRQIARERGRERGERVRWRTSAHRDDRPNVPTARSRPPSLIPRGWVNQVVGVFLKLYLELSMFAIVRVSRFIARHFTNLRKIFIECACGTWK